MLASFKINLFPYFSLRSLLTLSLITIFSFGIKAQVILPWIEDFEQANDTTYEVDQSSLPGLNGNGVNWEFSTSDQGTGRLRTQAGFGFTRSGNRAMTMDKSINSSNVVTNYLTLTLDLSGSSFAKDLELSFWYMDHGEEANNEDKVWIRGDSFAAWVEVYDLVNPPHNPGVYMYVGQIDIDSLLKNASPPQLVSNTFQVRFGQADNFQTVSRSMTDGFTFDDITISGTYFLYGTDASLNGFSEPALPTCGGLQNVSVDLSNNATDTIDSATVNWWVNGIAQTPVNLNGLGLLPRNSTTVPLGTYFFTPGSHYDLTAVVSAPNGLSNDRIPNNDTLLLKDLRSALNGTYTIDSSGSGPANFISFEEAQNDLRQYGICGPVLFQVAPGTYNESITLTRIKGSSPANTITYDGGQAATIAFRPSIDGMIVELNHVSNITFKKLNLTIAPNYSADCITITDSCRNITIDSCNITLPIESAGNGIVASGSVLTERRPGYTVDKLTISNCHITGGAYGIVMHGPDGTGFTTSPNDSVYIYNNYIAFQKYAGIWIEHFRALHIDNNVVTNKPFDFATGIYLRQTENLRLSNNTVRNVNLGIRLVEVQEFDISGNTIRSDFSALKIENGNTFATVPVSSKVINNIIHANLHDSGLSLLRVEQTDIFHNTIKGLPAIYTAYNDEMKMVNNILVSRSGNVIGFQDADPAPWDSLNHNLYFSQDQSSLFNFGGTVITDLSAWRSTVPTLPQYQSLTGDPIFLSGKDLHSRSALINDKGAAWPGVNIDIDHEPRPSGSNVDIGADEFNVPGNDLIIATVNRANLEKCGDLNQVIQVVIRNAGSIAQSNVNLTCNVSGDLTQTLTATVAGPINPGTTDTIALTPSINTFHGGDYTFTVFHSLAPDEHPADDTLSERILIGGTPELFPEDTFLCKNFPVVLKTQADRPLNIEWYASNSSTDHTVLATGPFATGPFTNDTTFWIAESKYGVNAVRITEFAADGNPLVELQNMGRESVNINGWTLAINKDYNNLNVVHNATQVLSGFLNTLSIKSYNGIGWGGPIYWSSNLPHYGGWILLIDNEGKIVDFVAWGCSEEEIYNLDLDVNGFNVQITPQDWTGDGLPKGKRYVRYARDNNDPSDWFQPASSSVGYPNFLSPIPGIGASGCPQPRKAVTVYAIDRPEPDYSVSFNGLTGTFNNLTAEHPSAGPYLYTWDIDTATYPTTHAMHTFPAPGKYLARLRATNDCGSKLVPDSIEVPIPPPIGIGGLNHEGISLSIHPNPSDGHISLRLQSVDHSTATMEIHNLQGKCVDRKTWKIDPDKKDMEFDLTNLQPGIYFMKLMVDHHQISRKLIIN